MGEITDFVELYVENSDILPEAVEKIKNDFHENVKSNLWKGHGYDKGELYRDIKTESEVHDKYAIIINNYTVEHGKYVELGIRGKGRVEPIPFQQLGLQKTLEMYK